MKFISFLLMAKVKVLSHLLFRGRKTWLSEQKEEAMGEIKLLVFLNHTSLFEPLFIRFAPWKLVWNFAHKMVVPGADVTLERPMTGRILKSLLPGVIPISRKQDESWDYFLDQVNEEHITAILPEGRMKRRNGLDKHGKPMSVRGGVADILERLEGGKILFVYSGGLHHIQAPGERLPRLFKTISANLELVDVQQYKQAVEALGEKSFKAGVMRDMNHRLEINVP